MNCPACNFLIVKGYHEGKEVYLELYNEYLVLHSCYARTPSATASQSLNTGIIST